MGDEKPLLFARVESGTSDIAHDAYSSPKRLAETEDELRAAVTYAAWRLRRQNQHAWADRLEKALEDYRQARK